MQRIDFVKRVGAGFFTVLLSRTGLLASQKELPRVLILGDSISIGYTPFVQEILAGKAMVVRPVQDNGKPENCAGTTKGLEHLARWIGETSWDLIHFNFGLHDIKHVHPVTGQNSQNPEDPRQAEPRQYKQNLKSITHRLKQTGASLIFATTTPYPEKLEGPVRAYGDDKIYNKIARRIMRKNGVTINDLHAFVSPQMADLQRPNNVHFTEMGSRKLAQVVSSEIIKELSLT